MAAMDREAPSMRLGQLDEMDMVMVAMVSTALEDREALALSMRLGQLDARRQRWQRWIARLRRFQ